MSFAAIRVSEKELSAGQTASLIHDLTEAVMPFASEGLRNSTWEIVDEGKSILDGIHVNLVQPGMRKTSRRHRLFEKLAAQEGIDTPAYIDRAIRDLRVTRLGEPDDVAELVAILSSGRSRWMQRSIVDVDGGQNKGV